ncbi:MAG: hypothetical protein KDH15_16355 [Rhodocyclaceae bacterium]|nr:hypothetical protein [Rhodocyclaceae bacterium]
MRSRLVQLLLAALPLAVVPALVFLLAEGWVDLGGGEKDILLAFPFALWSVIFFLVAAVLILRRWPPQRWLVHALLVSTGLLVILAALAYIASWLGVS